MEQLANRSSAAPACLLRHKTTGAYFACTGMLHSMITRVTKAGPTRFQPSSSQSTSSADDQQAEEECRRFISNRDFFGAGANDNQNMIKPYAIMATSRMYGRPSSGRVKRPSGSGLYGWNSATETGPPRWEQVPKLFTNLLYLLYVIFFLSLSLSFFYYFFYFFALFLSYPFTYFSYITLALS